MGIMVAAMVQQNHAQDVRPAKLNVSTGARFRHDWIEDFAMNFAAY
jgi:hypothetical protein